MHENTRARVTLLVNWIFSRLDKFDELIFGGHVYGGYYIHDVNWVTYLEGAYIRGGLYTGDALTGFYGIYHETIPQFKIKHEFFKNSFILCTKHKCNNLDPNIRNSVSIEILKNNVLKLVSAIFYQMFIFSSNNSPSKTMKNVFYFI